MESSKPFDFDYWKNLYEKDPYEFETEYQSFMEQEIVRLVSDEKKRARIRGILWKRNLEYNKLPQPERMNRVVKHFYEDLEEFRCALQS